LTQAISTAPHQAAELRHAQHERAAEEMALNRQWSGMQGLSDEPPSEEEDMFVHGHSIDDGSLQQNAHADDPDQLAADDDLDDDGMDKISSSPSITDGRYSPSVLWPRRVSSLTSASSPLASPSRDVADLSPFSSSPLVCSEGSPECLSANMSSLRESKPGRRPDLSRSPSPFSSADSLALFRGQPLQRHHHWGEYEEDDARVSTRSVSRITLDDPEDYADEERDQLGPLFSELDPRPLSVSSLERSASTTDLHTQVCAPFHVLDYAEAELPYGSERDDDYSDDSDWTTDSDCSLDSFNDDDAFPSDADRLICSTLGSESLQETEDIDFEFVYALHNFVATVEGQANATKGETMVLLDDSNSYWWLVRVVKDSTIGSYFGGEAWLTF
jgi:hypothetical protein